MPTSTTLSPTMKSALQSVMPPDTRSILEHDREPEMWVRAEPKPTIMALMRRGLIDFWQYDYPIGGYRGHLTTAGLAERTKLRRGRTGENQ